MAKRLFNRGHYCVLAQFAHAAEHFELELATEDRGACQHPMGRLGETRQTPANYVTNVFRNPRLGYRFELGDPAALMSIQRSRLNQVAQNLLYKNGLPSV